MRKTGKSGLYLRLPGEQEKYPSVVRKALKYVDEKNPRRDELVDWFKENYDVKIDSYAEAYAGVLENLGLLEMSEGKVKPTGPGYRFMETGDEKYLYKIISSQAAGFSIILKSLREGEKSMEELNDLLNRKYNFRWPNTVQTKWRAKWLMDLNLIDCDESENICKIIEKLNGPNEKKASKISPSEKNLGNNISKKL